MKQEFKTPLEIGKLWGVSRERVTLLARSGRIAGAFRDRLGWQIPADAQKPADNRFGSMKLSDRDLRL
jgi:hypothetical protein